MGTCITECGKIVMVQIKVQLMKKLGEDPLGHCLQLLILLLQCLGCYPSHIPALSGVVPSF